MQRIVTLALLSACASAEPDAPLAEDRAAQIATSIASTLRPAAGGGELDALLDAASLVRGELRADLEREGERTVRGQRAGYEFFYTLACRDDHNVARACDAVTDNADVDAAWSGVVSNAAGAMLSSRAGSWVVNDITSERLRIDGESHLESTAVTEADEHLALSYDASYRNVVLMPGEDWPRTGLVRYELVVGERTDLVRAEAQFAASGVATIALPDHAFELDLATGAVRPAQPSLE